MLKDKITVEEDVMEEYEAEESRSLDQWTLRIAEILQSYFVLTLENKVLFSDNPTDEATELRKVSPSVMADAKNATFKYFMSLPTKQLALHHINRDKEDFNALFTLDTKTLTMIDIDTLESITW